MTRELGRGGRGGGTAVLITYYLPPLIGPAAARAASFVRYLPESGWDAVVIAAADGDFPSAGDPEQWLEAVCRRTTSPELSRGLRRLRSFLGREATPRRAAIPPAVPPSFPVRIVRAGLYVPDAQWPWIRPAAEAAAEVVRRRRADVIFSSSVPFSAHLAANRVRRATGVPWVAEFRDPWTERARRDVPGWRQAIDRRIHAGILKLADAIVVTSDSTRKLLLEAYPDVRAESVHVVMNGWEDPPERTSRPLRSRPMSVVYTGAVAPGEDIGPMIGAFDQLILDDPSSVRLVVWGPTEPWSEFASRPWLELRGLTTASGAREAAAGAPALLLIQRDPRYEHVLPAKLMEYIGAGRPVLGWVRPNTEMARVLRVATDSTLVDSDDPADLAAGLRRMLERHREGSLGDRVPPRDAVLRWHRRTQAGRLAEVFDSVRRAGP